MTTGIRPSDLQRLRAVVAARLGLQFDDGKLDFLADVMGRRMESLRMRQPEEYLAAVESSGPAGERRLLAELLTVTETFFFRYWDHFRAFADAVLPSCLSRSAFGGRLRILSAGCASGEEPYSIAVIARERLPGLRTHSDLTIVGIDVNASMIRKAQRARYSSWSLRDTPEELRQKHFKPEGRELALDPSVQKMVAFEERNLVEEDLTFWRPGSFDVIFCRNVTMYFTPEMTRKVIARLAHALTPGGFLFLGHAETLRGISQGFHLRHTHDTFYYQRRESDETALIEEPPLTDLKTPSEDSLCPALVDDANSWVEAIQRASDRIAALAGSASRSGSDLEGKLPAGDPALPSLRATEMGGALELLRQERFSDALEILDRLPADASSNLDALLLRAVLLTNGGKLADAEGICRQILTRDELNAGAHFLMALCREHAGTPQEALAHDQTASYLNPDFA
ncbi:MAG TPA: CheR family methyltransferase, partial [Thermoplasmata archaeon]|nr:CheR family methyltransferase [Thermoplasmata archaeon]